MDYFRTDNKVDKLFSLKDSDILHRWLKQAKHWKKAEITEREGQIALRSLQAQLKLVMEQGGQNKEIESLRTSIEQLKTFLEKEDIFRKDSETFLEMAYQTEDIQKQILNASSWKQKLDSSLKLIAYTEDFDRIKEKVAESYFARKSAKEKLKTIGTNARILLLKNAPALAKGVLGLASGNE